MSFTVRLYTNDDSFTNLPPIPAGVVHIDVALAFARDYECDKSTIGKFKPYWDTDKVTPLVITQFKKAAHTFIVKVLVSIGTRNVQYPFKIEPDKKDLWVDNATESLTSIIKRYNLDGIDVYYEYIESGKEDFVCCIGKLMENLRRNRTISVASIAPTALLNTKFYVPLYQGYRNIIDTVVYQCFTETEPINFERLVEIFNNIPNQYPGGKKILAGYSTISKDWATVSPTLYLIALLLLKITERVSGPAIWIINEPVSSCVLKRILEVVPLDKNGPGILQAFSPK